MTVVLASNVGSENEPTEPDHWSHCVIWRPRQAASQAAKYDS